jgi:N4-(beta-N-acetylglucosaminyl)-L-asparaginase
VDAVVEGAALLEDDPEVESVGLGGIPNEEGVVELDASCMDGETMRAGAVAALRNVQNPSRVAKLVLERTTRVLLVGEGALRFARAHGFKEVNLLTERSRKAWLYWKERLNQRDDWIPGERELDDPEVKRFYERNRGEFWPDGTVHISCLGARGELAGCTSTSGLYFKLPGRVGDSPIIGAGLYVDGRVGAAGSTGWSEGNLQTLGSHSVVEAMRRGMKPEAAALEACRRVVDLLLGKRTEERDAPSRWNLTYYALNAAGQTGAASIWSGDSYAVHDGTRGELRPAAYLYRRG